MKPQTRTFPLLLVVLLTIIGLLTSACQFNVSRNADGSLTVETSISQQELQTEISAALSDPLIKNVTVSLQSGYILVNGERQRLNDSSKTDALSFRLDLGVSNGQLTATISNAQLDGKPLEQNRVDNWNQTIANRLQKFGQRRPDTSLQTVTITTEAVSMTWVITKK
jgi:hypothetical protein